MIPDRYSVADIEGTLCIKHETTSFSGPEIITHYWPTVVSTRDAIRYFELQSVDELAKLESKRTLPGEYFIGLKQYSGFHSPWLRGQHVRLLDGPHTQPVKTDVKPAPMPKVRKGVMLYWSDGNWVKHTKTRKPERINPLEVA